MITKTAIRLLEIIGVLVVFSSFIHAAPPLNDSFASPVILSGFPTNYSGSNVDATLEQDEPFPKSMAGDVEASVWFRWTATFAGPVQIDTIGSSFDTILAVWKGVDLDRLTELASNDDHGEEVTSAVFISTEVGVTYTVAVYGYDGETGLFALNISPDLSSRIKGTVTGPDGTTPLEGINVVAWRRDGSDGGEWDYVSDGDTDSNGHYSIGGLSAGNYRLEFADWKNENFAREYYDDAVDLGTGSDILVPSEKIVTGIDASLAKASRIAGWVTGPDGTTPLKGILVKAYRWTNTERGYWYEVSSADTDARGNYSLGGLAAGTYRVGFSDRREGDYIAEFYADAADLDSGADILVPAEKPVSGINASLAKASRIAGVVTGPDGITPLEGIDVHAHRWINTKGGYWDFVSYAETDASGNYSIGELTAGTYRVEFIDWQGDYNDEFYLDAVDVNAGTDIIVPTDQTVTGIDVSLASAVQPIQWVSAARSASPNGSNFSLLPWEYSEPVVVGLPPLPGEDPPTDTLARHYSVFNPLGVDVGLSAHNGLRGSRFTGGEGKADFRATFVVEETTSVAFTIDACYATSLSSGDVTASDVRLSLTREGTSPNLLTCVASESPQLLSLVPGHYELVASVHPKERFFQQTWSLLSVSMKALVDPPVPPVFPRELMAPQLEIAGDVIRVVVPESVVGRRYQLQTSVSTLVGSWVDVGSPGTGDGGPMVIQIPHEATAGQKFFRLKLDPQ